jgi:hypothetical protein
MTPRQNPTPVHRRQHFQLSDVAILRNLYPLTAKPDVLLFLYQGERHQLRIRVKVTHVIQRFAPYSVTHSPFSCIAQAYTALLDGMKKTIGTAVGVLTFIYLAPVGSVP